MNKTKSPAITAVSEYFAQGGMSSGFFLLESPVKETEKAMSFSAVKFNSYGNPYNGSAWVPKSKLQEVKNDFYTTGPDKMYLCPEWLYRQNFSN